MRNIFDQYSEPENQLTHALMCVLAFDSKDCKAFCRWVLKVHRIPKTLEAGEQGAGVKLGNRKPLEEKRGIPDGFIQSKKDKWILLIESKVAAGLTADQLKRHKKSAQNRGYKTIHLIVITVEKGLPLSAPKDTINLTWEHIYSYFYAHPGKLGKHLTDYMETLERKWTANEKEGRRYMKNGCITKFTGISFRDPDDFNQADADRLIKLCFKDIRSKKAGRIPGADFNETAKRHAISGGWNFIPVNEMKGAKHTTFPHYMMSIQSERVVVSVVLPNSLKTQFRNNLKKMGFPEFRNLLEAIVKNMAKVSRNRPGFQPYFETLQRRYKSIKSKPIIHSRIEGDIRVFFPNIGKKQHVSPSPIELKNIYDAIFKKKGANIQVLFGMSAPIGQGVVAKPQLTDAVLEIWKTLTPLVSICLGRKSH